MEADDPEGMWVDPVTQAWDEEYRYRQITGITHDQYLDEPREAVDWLLHIHDIREQARANRQQPAPGV